jgi:hypothetical protein
LKVDFVLSNHVQKGGFSLCAPPLISVQVYTEISQKSTKRAEFGFPVAKADKGGGFPKKLLADWFLS